MKKPSGAARRWLWALFPIACTAQAASTHVDADVFPAGRAGHVAVLITNTGETTVLLSPLQLPHGRIWTDLFRVTDAQGSDIDFSGAWAEPVADAMIELAPGAATEFEAELADGYRVQEAGEYSVALDTLVQTKNGGMLRVQSAPTQILMQPDEDCKNGCGDPEQPPPFEANQLCDANQIHRWKHSIVPAARTLATISRLHLRDAALPPLGERNGYWFGSLAAAGKAANISALIERRLRDDEVELSCNCSPDVVAVATAYVYQGSKNQIFICPKFWERSLWGDAPEEATDYGQAAIVVHEVSHMPGSGNTKDHAYTYGPAHQLAIDDPDLAADNGSNYQFHAQNNPCLDCTP